MTTYRELVASSLRRTVLSKEIENLDRQALAKMADKDLALWQSQFEQNSPQFRIAEHEWQRRLITEQIEASKFSAYIGLIGAIFGALIGAFITWALTAQQAEPPSTQQQPKPLHQQPNK